MNEWILAASLGGLILLGLLSYAIVLLRRVRQQQIEREQAIAARNERLLDSIRLIAQAMQQEQCGDSEGAIRLVNLLDALSIKGGRAFAVELPGLYGLYEQIKTMPTHEARRALKRNALMKLDLVRAGYEADFAAQIRHDIHQLHNFKLNQ
jgi:hypothetical protein